MTRNWRRWALILAYVTMCILALLHLGHYGQRVFGSYLASGHAALDGLNPFAAYPGTWRLRLTYLQIADVNLNPPILLPAFEAAAKLEPATAAIGWMLLSSVIYAGAASLLALRYRLNGWPLAFLFLWPLVFDTLQLGQIYTVLFAFSAGSWLLLDRGRPILAGLLLGAIIAIKPTFAVWPALLIVGGHWRIGGPALALAGAATLADFGWRGAVPYLQWLTALRADRHIMLTVESSAIGYFTRLGAPLLGYAIAASVLVLVAVWLWRSRPDPLTATSVIAPAMIVAAPLAWPHYALLTVPALISRRWNRWAVVGVTLPSVMAILPYFGLKDDILQGPAFGALNPLAMALLLISAMPVVPHRAAAPSLAENALQ